MKPIDLRPKVKRWNGQPWSVAEKKEDGYRVTVYRNGNGKIRAYARKPEDILHKLEHLDCWNLVKRIPRGSILDGELIAPSGRATDVPTVLAGGDGDFVCFAIPFWDEVDLRNEWAGMQSAQERVGLTLPRISTQPYHGEDDLLQIAEEEGFEGWVLKNRPYEAWYKLKVTHTIDCVVIACHMGTGTRFMRISSYDIGIYRNGSLIPIGTVKVQNEKDILLYHKVNTDQFVGRVCEVAYDEVAARGRLKFARWIRWRDDKPAEECTDASV